MINVYDLSNATPVAIFGMFALWAAVSPLHWFVRTAVVGAAILVTLLIPAYEVVILLTIETVVVVVGLAIWRKRRRSRDGIVALSSSVRGPLRVSMETLMLAVVVVAVVTAVAARAPAISLGEWYQTSLSGLSSGIAALICVWLVFGRAGWRRRLLAVLLIIPAFAFTHVCLQWAGPLLISWYRADGSFAFRSENVINAIGPNTLAWCKPVAVGVGILCLWMYLMHRAGWFNPFGEKGSPTVPANLQRRQLAAARTGLIALCCVALVFPLALFYRLLTPTPIPDVKLPEPNGFDDFVAAGRMINSSRAAKLMNWNKLPDAELGALVAEHAGAYDRVRQGLRKACWHPYGYVSKTTAEEETLVPLISVMFARCVSAERSGTADEQLAACWDFLRFTIEADRGTGSTYSIPAQVQQHGIQEIWKARVRLSAAQCVQLAGNLWKLERNSEPWETKAQRQRIIDENVNWQWRLQAILADWSGTERYEWARQMHLLRTTQMRILIVALGIRAYQLDSGKLPHDLSELVPKYLPEIPDDAFGRGPIKYFVTGDRYTLYSVGRDGDDDGGQPAPSQVDDANGDLTTVVLFPRVAEDAASMAESDYVEFSNKPGSAK